MSDSDQIVADHHITTFEPMYYNIWRQNAKTNEVSHFGNSEVRWVDNLLYLYTEPFDVVAGRITPEEAKKRVLGRRSPQEVMAEAPRLEEREHGIKDGKAGPGRGKKTADNNKPFYGTDPDYLAARLKRDAPEIAARIDGYTQQEIAEALNVSQSMVRDFISLVLGYQTNKTADSTEVQDKDDRKSEAVRDQGYQKSDNLDLPNQQISTRTGRTVADLLNKVANFTANGKFAVSGKTDDFEQETDAASNIGRTRTAAGHVRHVDGVPYR